MSAMPWPDPDPDRPIHLTVDQARTLVDVLSGLDINWEAAAVLEELKRQVLVDIFGDEEDR